MSKRRCEGKRRQFRKKMFGIFRRGRKVTGLIEITEHHYVCDDEKCFRSIAGSYSATFKSLKTE